MVDLDFRSVDGVVVELDGPTLRLTLDRPDKRNAINDTMVAGLIDALDLANRDERVRVILLRARGDHFCGGADIVARNAASAERPRVGSIQRRLPSQAHRLIAKLLTVQVPIVTAVRGTAAGIGLHLAAASDFCVAASDARFWEPFSTRGFTPDSAGTWLLPRLIGPVAARRLLLLGRSLSGSEAAGIGLVESAVDPAELDTAAEALAHELASGPTVSLGLTKWLMLAGSTTTLDDHLQNEALAMELSSRSEDFREGLKAFSERRPPNFAGR
ncbi:MAG: Enoyl-CoA hydratase/isomerase [Ilumatobacteraceae bacterium]|nr:Enoyl-CoA hydratase/isomerase [Ilumatobacteraceae bacterium]MCU1390412.1 Enoyl-CoA hydratase/isomerase [Ilumatobacteraceae bacterium]